MRSSHAAALVAVMLLTGVVNTLSKKVQNDALAPDHSAGLPQHFRHAWLQTLFMFLGEALAFPLMLSALKLSPKPKTDGERQALLGAPAPEKRPSRAVFVGTAALDLLGTSFAGVGLLAVDASIFQLMRSSIIVFAAVFSRFLLGRRYSARKIGGMAIVMAGLVLVGVASVLKAESAAGSAAAVGGGVAVILLGQVCNALQMVLEEKYVKSYASYQVVGYEGVAGFVLMGLLVLPLLQVAGVEDVRAGLFQIGHSWLILAMAGLYTTSICFFNVAGISVSKALGTVTRTLVDACRTILVWGVSVLLFLGTDGAFGESLQFPATIVQLAGFALLFAGTCVYNIA